MSKNQKPPRIGGQHYLAMKVLETPIFTDSLSKGAREAVAELSALKLVETPTYVWEGQKFSCVENVKVLSEKGRALLSEIRGSPAEFARLEREKENLIEESQKEVMRMWKKLFPKLLAQE